MRLLQQLDHAAEALKDTFHRRQLWWLCGFSLLYLAGTCLLASRRLMWNDELYTFYISRLSSLSDVWSALLTGAEQLPVFFYVVTRTSLALFGVNNLSIRLPEVLGFWVMCLCLFLFVSRRSTALYGFVAMLFPLVTGAYYYAYEARPYGIVLGFSGLALVCWQSAVAGYHRRLSLLCLALSLAGALSNHYYALFAFLPLALGEAVRSLSLRRLDLPVWAALGLALTPLFLFLPLIERARSYAAAFWSPPQWRQIPDFYNSLLMQAVLPLVATLLLAAVYAVGRPIGPEGRREGPRPTPRPHEIAAAFGFVAIPVVAVLLAKLVTNAFVDRYAMPAVIGFGILIAFAAYRLLEGRAILGVALVLFLGGWFVVLAVGSFRAATAVSWNQARTHAFLQSESESSLPIVASDPHTFALLAHYAPPDISSRVVYLADPGASLRHLGHNSVEQGMLDLIKPWFRLEVEEYGPYIASHRRFLVYGNIGWLNWLISELKADNRRIELRARNGDYLLFLVSPQDASEDPRSDRSAGTAIPSNRGMQDATQPLSR